MDILNYLSNYSQRIDKYLDSFFRQKIAEAKKIDSLAVDVVKTLKTYVKGGKKVRGALAILGYKIAGGQSDKDIIPVSAAVEIMHSALLIHDDFIDSDELRRGKPTVHEIYALGHSKHYGSSIALVIGDLGIFFANQIILNSEFPAQKINKALSQFQNLLIKTGHGEILDIAFDFKDAIFWKDIEKVRIYKTALYTFVMPAQTGAILAGANSRILRAMQKYGLPVGLAFQLRDDYLGIFGDSKITGKSTQSDIAEGKKTFLFVKALELAKEKEKAFLSKWYGSKNLDSKKITEIKKIIKDSGAVDFSEEMSRKFVEKGKSRAQAITGKKKYQKVLFGIADFTIARKK